ncbi:hypothetical protein F1559_004920 [Cyanidiococcus yangmingshanensis]|uniref:Fe2OG dioxygenase domain-containing protein n=1 Tax=Cyanidiococcus yangmingshanensis TaxID=2690220 RepID=A0A7J7IQM6_9RHOD|nr:hypothetical protein F1559_004920 [Cyanidiococcus yangmingshanensis]
MEAVDSNEFALCGDLNSSREQQRACSNRPSLRANLSQMSEGSCTFLQESARSGSMCEENEAPCPSSPRPREQHATVTRSLGSVSTNDGECACDDIDSSRYNQSRGPAELATTLRLLHYPSIPLGTVFNHEREGNDAAIEPVVLAGAHSDYGTFTLLYQDHVGGLELQIGERWVCIEREPTDPFGLLLNIGDVLWLWTRGRISSTVHRVVARARNDALERDDSLHLDGCCPDRRVFSEERFSVALFVHPLDDTVVDVVNGRRAVDVLNERLGRTYRNPGPCNG